MSRRRMTYDAYIAEQMRDPDFAQEVVLAAIREGESVQDTLKIAIESMGIKEFSDKSNIPIQNLSAFVRGEKDFGYKRMTRCLAVFDLEFTIARKSA